MYFRRLIKIRIKKMAVLAEIRKRSWLLIGLIAFALLAFLLTPDQFDQIFSKNPNILGKVNGETITREEYSDQLYVLQQQAQQQGQPGTGLEEQAWQMMVQSKLIKQQFEKMGLQMTDDFFYSQLQFDPMFAQNQQNFDEKGNFRLQEIKKQVADLQNSGDLQAYNQWMKTRKAIEYRMMARQLFANITTGITTGKKEAEELMKQRDQLADIDFVKVDYGTFLQKNPIKVTTADLANYIKQYPLTYKADPSVNLGVVYFPSMPSKADEDASMKEITNLLSGQSDASGVAENFQNTTNDSMFVMLNSELPFDSRYLSENQLPPAIREWVKTASKGQINGPYREQDVLVLTKLLDKKPSDSVLSKHILIAYEGSERSTATRKKEEAKKIADSLYAVIKGNPAAFAEGLKLSDEPNAVERNGSVGWVTPSSPFDPAYMKFLLNNPKGATNVVESAFGYHIINIEDKKSGTMGYKLAHIVKGLTASDATETEVDKNARRFIQQVQGKTFNDFANLAKKSNYNFSNAKSVKRFDGQIQGLGTPKDSEIISWAYDKKRKKGDTEFFVVEGSGDRVVVIMNGKQEKGLADPESVREQIEPIVKNQLAAKKIIEKMKSGNATGLAQVAKLFGTTQQSGQVNLLNPQIAGAMEPKVAGAAFGVAKGKTSNPVEGATGVYVLVKKSETVNKQPGDIKQMTESISGQNASMFGQAFLKSLQDNADIKDYRIEVWDKGFQ